MKAKLTYIILALVLALAFSTPVGGAIGTYVGPPTLEGDVSVVESAGVDKSQPDASLPATSADIDGEYIFVKIDLSKLPPIDEIFIVEAYLGFYIDSWSGSGVGGYASVATHFCGDNSWSASTLTWNNKPDHREEWTDSWGFSFVRYGPPYLGFYIDEDVEEALRAGGKMLTEVVTWGSGSGHAGLSSPTIRVEYAKRPVYNVSVDEVSDSPEINIAETNLVKLSVSDKVLWQPNFYASAGTYDLEFLGRCKFAGWKTSGGVSVANPNDPSTKVTINSDGELTLTCSLHWIMYGDEDVPRFVSDYGISYNATQRYAEKFNLLIPGYLRTLGFYIVKDPMAFEVHILGETDNPTSNPPVDLCSPIKVTPAGLGWLELDLTPQQVRIEKDTDFYVSVTWLHDGKPVFDEAFGASADTYKFAENKWDTDYRDILIQLIVSRSIEEPVKLLTTTSTTTTKTTPKPSSTTTVKTSPTTETSKTTSFTASETTITTTRPRTEPTYTFETTVTPTVTTTPQPTPIPGIDVLGFQILVLAIVAGVVAFAVGLLIRRRRKAEAPYVPPTLPPPPI